MDSLEISVLKYLGKVEEGILVLLNLDFKSEDFSFDATFYYTETHFFLTIPEEIEEIIGDVKDLPEYEDILYKCLSKVVPYKQMIDTIDPLDVSPYINAIFPNGKPE